MNAVRPIETRYKGYRFRSRLEARWAVFFDQAGIRYDYEPEGFALPSGAAYLPDFYLPGLGVYVEIKPSLLIPYRGLAKLVEFAHAGGHKLLLIAGSPGQEAMHLVDRSTCEPLQRAQDGTDDAAEASRAFLASLECWGAVRLCLSPLTRCWMLQYEAATPHDIVMHERAVSVARGCRFQRSL